MDDREIHALIANVRAGRLSRRAFTRTMVGLGLTAPLAAQALGAAGVAAQPRADAFTPTRRGGGGQLKVLWWQAPTLLNPHFAVGTKDQDGSRVFYEPLAAFDPEGNLFPILAQEIPSLENGGVARDGKSVTWKLKRGVTWHDGKPFTADDLVFNWEYAADPATAAITLTTYRDIEKVEKLDSHTVRLAFKNATPFWFDAFCGARGMIVPKHLFDAYRGAKSREAPANLKPVGTGPYRFVDFKPGDLVRAEINPGYHVANRPFFDQFEMKGGGDAASAARAVLQTGEYDFAWNLQVADDILKRLEQGGKGHIDIATGGAIEHIQLNNTDPWKEVDGERSSVKTTHPFLTDSAVRSAMNILVDRGAIHEELYGRLGQATPNFLNGPTRFRSPNLRWEFSVDRANQVLDA
ncbi:MAG: peptide ABC transporter substrate-binding protein, partial [Candidatus Rokuibacteriota bacterium]